MGKLGDFFAIVQQAWFANKLHNVLSKKLTGLKYFYYKKTAVIFNFCLIGNIPYNFLKVS
jgi:hypothetical protein